MADNQATIDGKPIAAPAVGNDGAPIAGDGNADTGKVVFGKHEFKSIEDAGRSYEESVRSMNLKAEEAAALRKENEALRQQAAQADILKDIAKNTAPREDKSSEFDAYVKQVAEKHDMSEEAVRDIVAPTSGWVADAERRLQEKIDAFQQSVDGRFGSMTAAQMKLTPEYRENQEWVDKLVDGGMPMDKAMETAKEIRSSLPPTQPDRIDPPGTVAGTRVAAGGKVESYISDAEWADLKRSTPELTDDMRAQMEADYQRRAKGVAA